jgi:hypothetical protein
MKIRSNSRKRKLALWFLTGNLTLFALLMFSDINISNESFARSYLLTEAAVTRAFDYEMMLMLTDGIESDPYRGHWVDYWTATFPPQQIGTATVLIATHRAFRATLNVLQRDRYYTEQAQTTIAKTATLVPDN